MKKFSLLFLMFFLAFYGCKTSEENYRKAYEAAKAKEVDGIEETIYNKIRNQAVVGSVITEEGDTIALKHERVRINSEENIPQERLKRFNIVVAQFKQLFHAKSMKKRMVEAGYPATFIVQTGEPLYYVVAVSTDNAKEAQEELQKFETSSPVKLIEPCPWILSPAGR